MRICKMRGGLMIGLAALLLCVSLAQAAPSRQQAIETVYRIIHQELRIRKEELQIRSEHFDDAEGYWTFSFQQQPHPGSDGQVFIQLKPDGTLNDLVGPRRLDEIALEEALKRDLRDPDNLRTATGMYALKQRWQDRLPALGRMAEERLRRRGTLPWFLKEYRALEADIRLPGEEMVPLSQAQETAEAAILALPGWTREKLDYFPLALAVYYHSAELGKPVYHLGFQQKRPAQGDPWEPFERGYIKPMEALFGDAFEKLPQYLSLRIDARTGQAAEAPVVGFLGLNHKKFLERVK